MLSWSTGKGVAAELTFARAGASIGVSSAADGTFLFQAPSAGVYRLAAVEAEGYLPFAPSWGASPVAIEARPDTTIRDVIIYLAPAVEYVGIVLSPEKERIEGAEVRITADDDGTGTFPLDEKLYSDRQGEVHFHAPDGALVEARHPGFAAARARIDLAAQVSRRIVFRLGDAAKSSEGRGPRKSIAGRVVGPDGEPAFGARVAAAPISDNPARPKEVLRPSRAAAVSDGGTFTIDDLDDGVYRVTASLEGHAPAWVEPVEAGATDLLIKIGTGALLRGHVRRDGGSPVTAFTLLLWRKKTGVERVPVLAESRIDPEGAFEVRGLAPGRYQASAFAHGLAPAAPLDVEIPKEAKAPIEIELVLSAGGCVKGLVIDEVSGKPIAEARVSGEGAGDASASPLPSGATGVTGADGLFELCGIAPGLRSVMAAADGHHARLVSGLEVAERAKVGPVTLELPPVKGDEAPAIELVGIGAVLSPKDDALIIGEIVPNGGAAETKLAPDDRIVTVDGVRVVDLGMDQAIQKIRGADGTTVRLGVRRPDSKEVEEVIVTRRKIRR